MIGEKWSYSVNRQREKKKKRIRELPPLKCRDELLTANVVLFGLRKSCEVDCAVCGRK